MGRLDGKVAIVTGAAQGIGATYAKALAAEGAAVTVADIDDGAGVVAEIEAAYQGAKVLNQITDVTDEASCFEMVAKTEEAFGGLDIMVANAAMFGKITRGPFEELLVEEWDALMAVNVKGPFLCARASAPAMRKRGGGKFINIASGTVFKGPPTMLHYVTSKGAILAMTRSLSRELGGDNICVNTIAPGLTMSENVLDRADFNEAERQFQIASRAIKREQQPDDLIGALLFLSTADSDFMSGQCLVVDGGSVNH